MRLPRQFSIAVAAGALLWAAASASADELTLSQPPTIGGPSSQAQAETAPRASASASEQPLALAPPRQRAGRELAQPHSPVTTSTSLTTVAGSLAVVLGLFFMLAWFMRRSMPKSMTRLPSEAVEQLGRAPLAGKQNVHLLRVGNKLLLVVVTPFGAETLTEITDPGEVQRLCALCKATGAHGPAAEFRQVLEQFEREPAGPGFLGNTHRADVELASATRGRSRGEFHA